MVCDADDLRFHAAYVKHQTCHGPGGARGENDITDCEPLIPEKLVTGASRSRQPDTEKQLDELALERMSTESLLSKMSGIYECLPDVIRAKLTEINVLISETKRCVNQGGRVFMVGAGTGGRIAADSASYCPDKIIVIPAGGSEAIFSAKEGAEDKYTSAWTAIKARNPAQKDIVIGISASGGAPFVIGALCRARHNGLTSSTPRPKGRGFLQLDGHARPQECSLPR